MFEVYICIVNWQPQHIQQMHSGAVYALAYDAQRGVLFSGGADQVVAAWNDELQQQTAMTIRTSAPIYSLCFVQAHRTLFIGLNDGSLHGVHMDQRAEITAFREHTSAIHTRAYDNTNACTWAVKG